MSATPYAAAKSFLVEILPDRRPWLVRMFWPHIPIEARIVIERHDSKKIVNATYRLNRGDSVLVTFPEDEKVVS
jgi:hypothetical protein